MNPDKTVLFTIEDSYVLRGIAVILITLCHYVYWDAIWQKHYIVFDVLTRVGPYGVSIFFLLSGYALVQSTSGRVVTWSFIWKRLKNMYLPYLLIVGFFGILDQDFTSLDAVKIYLSGNSYWYIASIIWFYIAFFLIWKLVKQNHFRLGLILLFTIGFSFYLCKSGHSDFWFVSNMAFPLGIFLAMQEKKVLKCIAHCFPLVISILFAGMLFFCWLGMWGYEWIDMHQTGIYWAIGANLWFCVFIVYLGQILFYHSRLLSYMGKHSLYLYLLHTPLYFRVMNHITDKWPKTIILAVCITLPMAGLIHLLCNELFKFIEKGLHHEKENN